MNMIQYFIKQFFKNQDKLEFFDTAKIRLFTAKLKTAKIRKENFESVT